MFGHERDLAVNKADGRAPAGSTKVTSTPWETVMQDINPIVSKIGDLRGRVGSLRGYL